jgi:hypothetical protein
VAASSDGYDGKVEDEVGAVVEDVEVDGTVSDVDMDGDDDNDVDIVVVSEVAGVHVDDIDDVVVVIAVILMGGRTDEDEDSVVEIETVDCSAVFIEILVSDESVIAVKEVKVSEAGLVEL